ncbi:olfactory receptor 52E4-like [Pelobates fuscus]|uniref:olfactory receptor 52E4-like n=1 Tax=Pelobates fuscus TaxID=191477 RepID=UPI002FE448BF
MLSFGEMMEMRYVYVVITLIGFIMIILSNGVVIYVIMMHKSLQEPMYIFISALCVNGLYGSISFFPSLLVNLLDKTQAISYVNCLVQVFCIHTYTGCEMALLAVMAFDRYLCICNPLRYNNIMTMSTTYALIIGAWFLNIFPFTIHLILTIRLPLCGTIIPKIYCDNFSVVNLSCIDTTVNNIYGLFITIAMIVGMPILILASYIRILRVCANSSKDFRAKALKTCTPHLITMINYVADILFEVLLHRFRPQHLPYDLKIIMSVQAFVVPPLLNPLIYGLKMREIRVKIFQLFLLSRISSGKTSMQEH